MNLLERSYYLPACVRATTEPVTPEGTDLAVYSYQTIHDGVTRYFALVFQGRATKPLWHIRFASEASRAEHIASTVESRKRSIAAKSARVAQRRAFKHTLKVGDVLVCSWGYDQTNIDYYVVVALHGEHDVSIAQCGSKLVRSDGGPCDYVVADPDSRKGEPMRKRVGEGNAVKVHSWGAYARPWRGEERYQTALGWGH